MRAIMVLLLAACSATLLEAQEWSRIVPRRTSREQVETTLGQPQSWSSANGTPVAVYASVLDATRLDVMYDASGTVDALFVVPSTPLREADMVVLFGSIKNVIGTSGDGTRIVHYPVGGARAYYRSDGTIARVEVTGGVATQGLNADGLLRSLIGGRRRTP